ncbi:MAG TPA: NADH-quinone oxidoreductase subunit NuoH [Candidatus Bathyarchaeia archaeon]|nr:NADH-quinone oxidoreductase subunit NuoH [Candidatus Bathyarchaeia archaeon]
MIDISGLIGTIMNNPVNIPLLYVIYDLLLKIPVLGGIVAFLLDFTILGMPIVKYIIGFVLWKPFFTLIIIPGFATLGTMLLVLPWLERKLVGRMQWRVGPREIEPHTRGSIQLLADTLRFLFQEVIIHKDAHKHYFLQFPFLYFIPVLLPLLFINAGAAGHPLVPIQTDYALQIMIGLVSLMPVFIIGVAWAANNRFSFIGAVREAFMYFAYEIPFIIAVLAMIVLYGTSNTAEVISGVNQSTWLHWGVILNPLAALTFFIATAMATSRLPFDIPEADQEVAFGPFVEYTGIVFGLAYIMAYEKAYVLAAIMTMLFFGGGSGPVIPYLGELSYGIWFVVKTLIILLVLVNLRGVYPRYRIDQALGIGWSAMLTFALVALVWSIVIGVII